MIRKIICVHIYCGYTDVLQQKHSLTFSNFFTAKNALKNRKCINHYITKFIHYITIQMFTLRQKIKTKFI